MKHAKTSRILCVVLALLMVLAVCPVIALAEDTTAQAEEITYWDGTVPGLVDGAEVDNVLAEGQSVLDYVIAGTKYQVSLAQFEAHVTHASKSLTALDEIGFAMLTIMSSNNFEILENDLTTVYFDGARSTNTAVADGFDKLLDLNDSSGNTAESDNFIYLGRDLYLNDPKADPSTWNDIAPLYTRATTAKWWEANNSTLTFDGQGHSIVGWSVNHTMTSKNAATFASFGLFGLYSSASLLIQNVAMLNMSVDITVDDTVSAATNTLLVGGLLGSMRVQGGAPENLFHVNNVIVDMDVEIALSSTNTGRIWYDDNTSTGSGFGNAMYDAFVGGIAARTPNSPYSSASNMSDFNVSNALIMVDANVTDSKNTGFGAITHGLCSGTNTFDNVIAISNATNFKVSSGTFRAGTVTTATDVWNTSEANAKLEDPSNKVVSVEDIVRNGYWDENGAGMADAMTKLFYPVPATLATNEAVVAYMEKAEAAAKEKEFTSALKAGTTSSISTGKELVLYATLANSLGKAARIQLTDNIDMAGLTMPTIKVLALLEGNGHVISNLTIDRTVTSAEVSADGTSFGGFCDMLGVSTGWDDYGGKILNVAFINYSFTLTADSTVTLQFNVGGLFGGHQRKEGSEVTNVVLQGNLELINNASSKPVNSGRLGTFGAMRFTSQLVGITFNNCVFAGSAKASVVSPFMEALSNASWSSVQTTVSSTNYEGFLELYSDANRMVQINNCYSIPYTVDKETGAISWNSPVGNGAGSYHIAMRNFYQTGSGVKQTLNTKETAFKDVVDTDGYSLAFLGNFNVGTIDPAVGTITIRNPLSGSNYVLDDFIGKNGVNALDFTNPDEWTYFADGTPIPAVFGANAQALSIKNIEESTSTSAINFQGAQLRLDKYGFRFIGEFKELTSIDGYNTEYGFLILPTVAITGDNQELTYENPIALKISVTANTDEYNNYFMSSDDTRLNGVEIQAGNKALFAVMAFDEVHFEVVKAASFTVVPFVAFTNSEGLGSVIYGETMQYTMVEIANAAAANENETIAVRERINELFAGTEGFVPADI